MIQARRVHARRVLAGRQRSIRYHRLVAGASDMNFSQSKDERLLAFYENVRRQVELDSRAGGRYRLVGEGVKQYAERLREEMDRRRLRYNRIEWP